MEHYLKDDDDNMISEYCTRS